LSSEVTGTLKVTTELNSGVTSDLTLDLSLTSKLSVTLDVPRRSVVSEETVEESGVTVAVTDLGSLLVEEEEEVPG